MCGVVGYWPIKPDGAWEAFRRLFTESSIRGLHAFGIVQSAAPLRSFNLDDIVASFNPKLPALAHARYCTSGDWRVLENNQPLSIEDDGFTLSLVFNGVIHMGTKEEFEAAFGVHCEHDNDGEVFLRRLELGNDPADFLAKMTGSFAGCWLDSEGKMFAGRNARRPLWRCDAHGARWYASTRDIFHRAGFTGMEEMAPGVEALQ